VVSSGSRSRDRAGWWWDRSVGSSPCRVRRRRGNSSRHCRTSDVRDPCWATTRGRGETIASARTPRVPECVRSRAAAARRIVLAASGQGNRFGKGARRVARRTASFCLLSLFFEEIQTRRCFSYACCKSGISPALRSFSAESDRNRSWRRLLLNSATCRILIRVASSTS
jgi:hypothetical protein